MPSGTSVVTGVLTPTPAISDSEAATRLAKPDDARTGLTGGGLLSIGQNFGTRYHIIRLLGAGGMGSVYQAWDQELEIAVALKVIRPDVTADPLMAQELERRFKRELLLARKITDKHVVRIHDIGEINGIKYITMPYIHGADLATILKREGRLPAARAVAIARQIAAGLLAAHEAGVVHRDLKPANIMIDEGDHAVIMDFGIARSTAGGTAFAATMGGQVIGTVEYMAPEQARGETVDQRADLYAFGLILRDMLLGGRAGGSTSAVAELVSRMQHSPAPLRSVDSTISEALDTLVTRCVQPDAAARYQTAADLLRDIDRVAGGEAPAIGPPGKRWMPPTASTRMAALAAIVLLLVLGTAAWFLKGRLAGQPSETPAAAVSGPAVTLAVLPFRNASGDPTLDSMGASLSEVLNTTLGQSAHVRTVQSDRLYQVLRDLQIAPNAALAPTQLASVADFTNARHVLWGSVSRFGTAIRIDATLQDLDRNETIPLNAVAANENGVLNAVSELADRVRENLARGSADVLAELESTSWKPSTSSFEALRLYNDGVQFTRQGTHQEALKSFEAATKQDPNFALAYAGLAQAYSTLGYDAEAARASRQAMALADSLPPQEKHRSAARHYSIVNDSDKAIESYENLVKAAPADTMVRFELGGLYEQLGALDKAHEHFANVVELDPKFVEGLLALGRVEIKSGNPQPSLEYLDRALSLATQLDNDEARANVQQAIGIAYMRLNRPKEALTRYQESLEIKERLGNKRGMAASYVQMGEVQIVLGQPEQAEKSYHAAVALRREIGDKAGLSLTLMDLAALLDEVFGRQKEALPHLQEALTIARDLGNRDLEARALNNIGAVYVTQGRFPDAQTYFERALEMREQAQAPQAAADTLHNLADTFTRMGRYDQALQRYIRALDLRRSAGDRRGAALASYGIGTIFDYQGRFGSAVKSKGEALQSFRDLKQRDAWLAVILSGYGHSLTLAGRFADAQGALDEAQRVAEELNNANLLAQITSYQADRLYYSGDRKRAQELVSKLTGSTARVSDRSLALLAEADAAIISSKIEPTAALASRLASLAQEADSRGLKSSAVECLVQRVEVLHARGDDGTALREGERALARAEELGLKVPLAKAHFLRASILAARKDPGARQEYAAALRLLEQVKSDSGDDVLKRADLAPIYAQAREGSTAP